MSTQKVACVSLACYPTASVLPAALEETVAGLEREVAQLEERCAARESEVRAPAVAAQTELTALESEVATEQARLSAFKAEIDADPSRRVVTLPRAALATASLGLFTFGAAASGVDLTRVSVGLFSAVWVAFLIGALRGR
jgi:hypothetical protein